MTIHFTNCCRHIVILNIDNNEPVILQPFESKPIIRNDSNVIKVLIKRACESIKKYSIYHLVLEIEYHFTDVFDGAVFTITREKIRFSLKASYERLFLRATNASYLSEIYKVVSEDKIKKVFNKSRLFDFIFDAFMASPVLVIILIIAGISLTFIWGWKIAVIYFPLAFLFIGALNWLIDKFWKMIGKKAFKIEDEKTEFYNYFENDFINSYYSDISRSPFMGNVETD